MRVLLTGGTGFIGSSILRKLIADGIEVVAVVRSDESAATVNAAGATALVHALPDTEWLTGQLAEVDGAIHAATTDDGTAPAFDDSIIDAVIAAFSGTTKPYVHTGGVWAYGSGDDITEHSPIAAPAITAWRQERQARLLAADVKASIVEPGIVYGYGKGIPAMLVGGPHDDNGALHLIGSGEQHWTTVNVDDLADLYALALTTAPGGEVYLGVSGQNPTVEELGRAIVGSDGELVPETEEETSARFGEAFTEALLLDQQASGRKARDQLGWAPHRSSLVLELLETED